MANTSCLGSGALLRNGTYRIVRFLGHGGFGCTYEAVFEQIGVRVAIKEFFPQNLCNRDAEGRMSVPTDSNVDFVEKMRRKFVDEARTLYINRNLEGVVKVKDVFDENGTSYFVMDFVEGQSIQRMIDEGGTLPESAALHIIEQVARSLSTVHSHNLLHLDIKPDNIMIGADGLPVLIDFGVAKQFTPEEGCNTSTLMGFTPGFAPIEQMNANVHAFLPATDIYSLGATLYAMLTGKRPPKASDILNEVESLEFPSYISPATRSAIEAAMQPRVKDRPQSVEDFLAMLHGAKTSAKPIASGSMREGTRPVTARKPDNKNRLWIAAIAVGVLLIGIFAFFIPSSDSTVTNPDIPEDSISMAEMVEEVEEDDNASEVEEEVVEEIAYTPTVPQKTEPVTSAPQKTGGEIHEAASAISQKTETSTPQKTGSEILDDAIALYRNQDYKGALPLFRKVDKSSISQFYLGVMYEYGYGVAQDYAEAVRWYRKSADQGDKAAQFNLGVMYEMGRGVAQDYAEAVRLFRKLADQGDDDGQCALGVMYEYGKGVPQDASEAVRLYRKAADQGLARAQCNLGTMYDEGKGVAMDDAEAVRWYRKAAEQGYARGQRLLGLMYEAGEGVAQDYAEAVRWYRKAAEQGDANGQCFLGTMYDGGRGVAVDDAEAVRWYRKAANQGHARAQYLLGTMYDEGEGVALDDAEAVRWYRKAAEQGHSSSQFNLGIMYENGEGVGENYAEAARWYRKAADQGHANAQCALGFMYDEGKGVALDDAEAIRWYRKAANQGNARAQFNLGVMYYNGEGVSENVTEAVELWRKAAAQGYQPAIDALKKTGHEL